MYHSRFKGSHYEAGFKYGNILAKNNINPLSKIIISKERKDFCKQCMPIYKYFFPEVIEEIKGISDGLNTNNTRINYKSLCDFLFTIYSFTFDNKCSSFAFKPDATTPTRTDTQPRGRTTQPRTDTQLHPDSHPHTPPHPDTQCQLLLSCTVSMILSDRFKRTKRQKQQSTS